MPDRVADASIMAAIAFQEPEAGEALSLITGADLYEPAILYYELASVARKKIARDSGQTEAYILQLQDALAMDVTWVDVNQVAVVRMALDTGLTTYDASYLYVARIIGAPLVTFDARLSRASQSHL